MRLNKFLKVFVISFAFVLSICFVNVNAETLQEMIDSNSNVTLSQNVTEKISIPSGKNVTLDLNGKTITGAIEVKGNLTIKDSKNGGAVIANTEKNASAIEVDGGKFTLQSGIIKNDKGYGVSCSNSGKAIISGGTVDTLYSGLTGNNTTGDMNFTVNSGTVKAKYGPAIYMPGQGSLTITDGNLIGGISIRMGDVSISGGNITAITSDIDKPSEYYSYSGNAWFPDAIYVIGGTYNSKSGNDLSINITGGVITSKNGQGSALAIYDLGKISQKMNVSISGNAKLITDSKTRASYDVLNLSDIGVTNPKSGFNNPSYIGKVSTSITGGTYSNINDKYIASGYDKNLTNGNYVVSKKQVKVDIPVIDTNKEVKNVTVGVTNYTKVKGVLLASLEKSNIKTEGISPVVDMNIESKSASEIDKSVINSIKNIVNKQLSNAKIADYFDISILVKDSQSGELAGSLSNLNEKIKFTVALPSNLTKLKNGYERDFYIVREHNGVSTIIPCTLSKDKKFISFESDEFSTFALAYKDVEETKVDEIKNPQTYDGITGYFTLMIVTLGGSVGAVVYLKRNSLNN